jgi:diguanylate cyclase (GGDEF)-like protein
MPLRRLLPALAALLILALALVVAGLAAAGWEAAASARRAGTAVYHLRAALAAAEMVSRERGPSNGALGSASPATAAVTTALDEARGRTDAAWAALKPVLSGTAADPEERAAAGKLAMAVQALAQARQAVDRLRGKAPSQREPQDIRSAVSGMVAVVPLLAPAIGLLAHRATSALPAVGDPVQGARLSAELRENAGLLGSLFTAALARQQPFTPGERAAIERTRGRIDALRLLIELRVQLPGQDAEVLKAWELAEAHYFQQAGQLLAQVIAAGESDGRYGMDPAAFAARYVPDMNTLFSLRDVLLQQALTLAAVESDRVRVRLLGGAAVLLLLVALLLASLRVLQRRVLEPLQGVTRALEGLARNELDATLPVPRAADEMAAVIDAVSSLQAASRERLVLEAERQSLMAQLRSQSSTDFLTELPNRRAFFESAEQELALARRQGEPVVAVLLDIDNFKQFNDRHGHSVGDQALRLMALALRRCLRAGDLVARFGGEEFVLLLMRSDRAAGRAFAERLRLTISELQLRLPDGSKAGLTASIGLAASERGDIDLDKLLGRADAAMYRAKALGRDRMVVAGEEFAG